MGSDFPWLWQTRLVPAREVENGAEKHEEAQLKQNNNKMQRGTQNARAFRWSGEFMESPRGACVCACVCVTLHTCVVVVVARREDDIMMNPQRQSSAHMREDLHSSDQGFSFN